MVKSGYELDEAQLRAMGQLQQLGERRRGVYLHGPVGRGKSFLADAFFEVLPAKRKRRVHFHAFFQELHARISARLHERGAVKKAVDELIGRCDVLAFDEFHLHDIGDAMLMTRLLEALRASRTMVVATSNYPPDGLLPNPLYHDLFLPGIALVKELMDVVELTGGPDYRLLRGRPRSRFETGGIRTEAPLPDDSGNQVWFDFGDLCEKPTSTQDYLEWSKRFDDWVITAVPRLETVHREARQRFANVVDVLVDKDIRLTLVSDHPLKEIVGCSDDSRALDLARTASRLELINTTG
ncbi:cell division protein ZapE [Lentzea aerocolonigenes]|uniref:cell division protein ZapE n=1 Tax=Lentzea aerocolonigenes TaxID=68170 RepID=UPI0006977595|nr:cell division protein ZapE [Lentzea aerocolonigenes]